VVRYRLTEEELIKLLFTTIDHYNKYRLIFRDDKTARYAAACQSLTQFKEGRNKKKPVSRPKVPIEM
jgi:hypothetical protein